MKAASFSSLEETQFDKTATMKILLEHGADVNTKNELGKITLLMSQYLFYIFNSNKDINIQKVKHNKWGIKIQKQSG